MASMRHPAVRANMCSSIAAAVRSWLKRSQVWEVDRLSWLVRERATGKEWCVETSDMAWEAGGYDPGRFEVHVADTRVVERLGKPLEVGEGRASTVSEPGVGYGCPFA